MVRYALLMLPANASIGSVRHSLLHRLPRRQVLWSAYFVNLHNSDIRNTCQHLYSENGSVSAKIICLHCPWLVYLLSARPLRVGYTASMKSVSIVPHGWRNRIDNGTCLRYNYPYCFGGHLCLHRDCMLASCRSRQRQRKE